MKNRLFSIQSCSSITPLVIVIVSVIGGLATLPGCGGTLTGNPTGGGGTTPTVAENSSNQPGDTTSSNAVALTTPERLLQSLCTQVSTCYSPLSVADCEAGVLPTAVIDSEIGLLQGYGTYAEIVADEKAKKLVVDAEMATACIQGLESLSCESIVGVGAFSRENLTDYSNIQRLFLLAPVSCGDIF